MNKQEKDNTRKDAEGKTPLPKGQKAREQENKPQDPNKTDRNREEGVDVKQEEGTETSRTARKGAG